MEDKYYREINSNKDIIKLKLQLGAILLKLNNHSSNILNNKNNIIKLDTDIKNNDKDIKSNYDISIGNSNNLTDIDKKIYAINNNITKINNDIERINKKDIIKHYYTIESYGFIILTYLIRIQSVHR